MALVRFLTEGKVPRRMACRVTTPKKISTMSSDEHPVGYMLGDLWLGRPAQPRTLALVCRFVQDDAQLRVRVGGGDLLPEPQELLVPVPGIAGVDGDLPDGDLQGGEQGGGAVALVVMGAPLGGSPGRSGSIGAVRISHWICDSPRRG